ncbi:MAG: universal stress protein [Chloroflexi bacterium]|nr:universal stress protein [Chloroflexota bacterium]
MYRHIMVPLDGSKLAECVLPHAAVLAKVAEKITFTRVTTPFRLYEGIETRIHDEMRRKLESDESEAARRYLDDIMARQNYYSIPVHSVVLFGKVTEQLVDFAEKNGVDLIVMATHGRSGVSRFAWGSVADRLLRTSRVPVLMVRSEGCSV